MGKADYCLWSKYGLCSDLGMIDSAWGYDESRDHQLRYRIL